MAELKTKPTDESVTAFLQQIADDRKRQDAWTILEIMQEATGLEPKMWGDAIIGFGDYHYKYASGREGDWFLAGFSPRKQNFTIYIMGGLDQHKELLAVLGRHKTGVGCVYINRLSDVDLATLRTLVVRSVEQMRRASDQ